MGADEPGTAVRWSWLALAYVSLAIGLAGVVLPVLPTTPFILVAAFAADRGSPRLHAWLMDHRVFGPVIRDWRESRAVRRRAKVLATVMMLLAAVIMAFIAAPVLAAVATLVMAAVGTWLWTRPEPTRT
ncbi:MAG: YbaN family protein [Thermoleophilia bacterium]|nr:YbaN family protein [Thermoleophilia bacterium]